jgi:hypothetical protein
MGARPLPFWTCEQCGAQFPDSGEPPVSCPVCEDERQFVNWKGHAWLTREELAKRHKLVWREDLGISGIGVEPGFAIGQRALLVREPDGCVLWDCVPLLTNEAVEHIRSLGASRRSPYRTRITMALSPIGAKPLAVRRFICMPMIAPGSPGRIPDRVVVRGKLPAVR